jgi:hypothetical protein
VTTVIDEGIRAQLRDALLSPDLYLGVGVGSAWRAGRGEACTIAEIMLVLTGHLTDGPHPCVSEVIRRWVIQAQDAMPGEMRNALEWRDAAVGIAGSAATDEVEHKRADMVLEWMWAALGDDAVLWSLPHRVSRAWRTMLAERTSAAAAAVSYAFGAPADIASLDAALAVHDVIRLGRGGTDLTPDCASAAVGAVACAAECARDCGAFQLRDFWARRNPADLLTRLIAAS